MNPREVPGLFETCRQYGRTVRKSKIDPDLQRDLEHGWLIPYLLKHDELLWGRWDYWCEAMMIGRLPDRPIPQIEFAAPQGSIGEAPGHKHLQYCLDLVMNQRDSWQSWDNWIAFNYFISRRALCAPFLGIGWHRAFSAGFGDRHPDSTVHTPSE